MLSIKIGNKYTTISGANPLHTLTKQTTIKFSPYHKIQIGLNKSIKNVIYDFLILLGTRYQDEEFSRYAKFYGFDFQRNKWGKIQIISASQAIGQLRDKLNVETLLALYLKKLINQFRYKFYGQQFSNYKQFISAHKCYISISGSADHPSRYALKQACQIAQIDSPILINCTHAAICSFYFHNKKQLIQSEDICIIRFADRATTVSIYKMQGFQQNIIQVTQHKTFKKGGYHLTKTLSQYVVQKIKQQKGIDINRHTSYMSLLHSQCQKLKIQIIQSQQKQAHIRIPDLPDDSTFGKIINLNLLTEIIEKDINQIINFITQTINKYPNVKQLIIMGGSSQIPLFQQKIKNITNNKVQIIKLGRQHFGQGIFIMKNNQIVLFDIADGNYEVIGEEGFKRKLMTIGQPIPERRSQKTNFPAGQLQFNLRVYENQMKVAHFIMDSRPTQSMFSLNFQIDRNKMIWLYAKTDKGKIDLIPNFEAMGNQQMVKQLQVIKQYEN